MPRFWSFLMLAFSGFLMVGCGDSPKLVMRDCLTFMNELADTLSSLPDDDSAEEAAAVFVKSQNAGFKARFDHLRHRIQNFTNNPDKETKADIKEGAEFWKNESEATLNRLLIMVARFDKIIDHLADQEAQRLHDPKNGKYAQVGIKSKMEKLIAQYEAENKTLIIVERETAAPNLSKMKAAILAWGRGGGVVPEEKKEERN